MGLRELYARAAQFSCWAGGYHQNAWLAYCNSDRYGVYDADAVWNRSEPDITEAIARAQVLTLSDSHLQNALSLGGASDWFRRNNYPLYMLGLPTEESGFGYQLLIKFQPHPAVVIFDVSPYFTGAPGTFEKPILAETEKSLTEIAKLRDFQKEQQWFCARLAWACGHNFAYFRSREDGHWIFPQDSSSIWIGRRSVPNDRDRFPVDARQEILRPLYPTYLQAAQKIIDQEIIDRLHVSRQCIVLTNVPSEYNLGDLPEFLAKKLDVALINPQLSGLATFDRAHLTPESSRRWTEAFIAQLQPVLQRCISSPATLSARN